MNTHQKNNMFFLSVLLMIFLFCNFNICFAKNTLKDSSITKVKKIVKKIHAQEITLTSCDTMQKLDTVEDKGKFIHVPLIRQFSDYDCGVVATQSILAYYGLEVREDKLMKYLDTTHDGTSRKKIEEFTRKEGFIVEERFDTTVGQLKRFIDSEIPVMIPIQAWLYNDCRDIPISKWKEEWDSGHWVVVVGYDSNNIYFMDPSTLGDYTLIPIKEFEARWHDKDDMVLNHYALIITKSITDKKISKYINNDLKRLN